MTKENAQQFLPIVKAFAEGITVQYKSAGQSWHDCDRTSQINFYASPSNYRIKPEPKTVPLGPEDVPPGSVLRFRSWGKPTDCWVAILQASETGGLLVGITTPEWVEYEDLNADYEIKRPGQDWMECSKTASE